MHAILIHGVCVRRQVLAAEQQCTGCIVLASVVLVFLAVFLCSAFALLYRFHKAASRQWPQTWQPTVAEKASDVSDPLYRMLSCVKLKLGCKACDREQGSFEKQGDEKREPNRTERLLRRCALANPTVASYV